MNLVVEIGNTNTKLAFFEKRELIDLVIESDSTKILTILNSRTVESAILAGSGNTDIDWWMELTAIKKVRFDANMLREICYAYLTPQSLGADRLINAWFANRLFPMQTNLIIDTGTCITFTLIDTHKTILGGSISPGLSLRAQSLHDHTDKLPLIDIAQVGSSELVGNSTESSIRSGIILGTLFEIDKRIEQYQALWDNLKIIMTGGGTQFFENKLNYKIFADNHFTLKGLNEILLSNE